MTTFISYSRDNSAFVMRLAKDLKAAGFNVWLDQLDIPKGARWDDEIESAVEKSTTFMVILAPESIESQNVKDELSYAIDTGKHILPVIIKPCKIPLRLRRFQHVDFTDKPYKESLADIKRLLRDTKHIPKGAGDSNIPVGEQKSIPAAFKENRPQQGPSPQLKTLPVEKSSGKNRNGKYIMPAAIIAVLGIAATAVIMAVAGNGLFSPPPATSTSTSTSEPPAATQTATVSFTATSTAPASGQFYTEEFDQVTFDWTPILVSGLESQINYAPVNGSLAFQLTPYQDKVPSVLLVNKEDTYTDVELEAVVTNNGNNANAAILACRVGENGWYGFEISSGGTYAIKAVDTTGKLKDGYKILADGGSTTILYGKVTNVYRAVCEGNELSLFINDTPIEVITEDKFNFAEGYIGIGAASPEKLPVDLQFDSIKVSLP